MSKGRLTRQELSWLLTQEAQNAAERLRLGVKVMRQGPPSEVSEGAPKDEGQHVDASLDALDDVMRMLQSLNLRAPAAAGTPPRRGRIDVAALLVELAPDARVSFEPGGGTEIYGDEADLRRMLQVLVGHGGGSGGAAQASVRREGDDVRVSITLGPDASPTAETERVWLSRMAIRYGGRHELDGGSETLVFPAEAAEDASERAKLQKELDEARRQGEVYARELAAMIERGVEVASNSNFPHAEESVAAERFAVLRKVASGVGAALHDVLAPLGREVSAMRRHEVTDEQLDTLRRRAAHAQAVAATVGAFGAVRADELATEVDLARVVESAAAAVTERAEHAGVVVEVESGARVHARVGEKALHTLVRELVAHGIEATPRGGTLTVSCGVEGGVARIAIDDGGPALPSTARRAYLAHETEPGSYGRPSGLTLMLASELASCLGARVELEDAPSGGLRTVLAFPRREIR